MFAKSSAVVSRRRRPPGYATELEQMLGGLTIRPVVPQDVDRLRAEFESADGETLRMRFFVPKPHLSSGDFERLTTVDYDRRLAITAWDGNRPAAIGRFEPAGDTTAEVAFVVKPAYRNQGVGRGLIEILATAAADRGYQELEASYLAENVAAAAALKAAGFSRRSAESGVVEVSRSI